MLKSEKFGPFEGASMVIVLITGKMFLTSPRLVIDKSGTAAWLVTLVSAIVGLLGFYIILALLKRFPGKDIMDIFNIVFGRKIGGLFILMFFLLFMYNGALTLREFVESMKTYVYPLSPPTYMIGALLCAIIPLCYFGIESIGRTTGFCISAILGAVTLIMILAIPLYKPYNLTPVFGYGLDKAVLLGTMRSSVYGEVLILAVFSKCLQGTEHIKKAGVWAVAVSGAVLVLSFISIGMVYSFSVASELTIPIFQLTRIIRYSRFIQRLESIFIFAWSVSAILMVTILFFTSLILYSRVFDIRDYKPLVLPGGVLLFALSMYPPDITSIAVGQVHIIRQYAWIIYFILPAAALAAASLLKKGGSRDGKKNN